MATANYLGYLIGALAGILIPGVVRSAAVMRTSLVVLIATLALMPTTHDGSIWFALRLVAGIASALVFMIAVSALHAHLRGQSQFLAGWGFGGVGLGIALSGVLVLVVRFVGTWSTAWLASAPLQWCVRSQPGD